MEHSAGRILFWRLDIGGSARSTDKGIARRSRQFQVTDASEDSAQERLRAHYMLCVHIGELGDKCTFERVEVKRSQGSRW